MNISNWTFRVWNIFFTKNVLVFVLIHLESLSKNRTIVKSSRTMGGFEIFQNRTIAKSVLIETVLWGDSLYFKINFSFSFPSPQWLGVTMTKGCLWQLVMKFTLVGYLPPLLPYSYWVVSRFTIRSRIQIKFNFCHFPADSRISLECYSLRQSGYVFIYKYLSDICNDSHSICSYSFSVLSFFFNIFFWHFF